MSFIFFSPILKLLNMCTAFPICTGTHRCDRLILKYSEKYFGWKKTLKKLFLLSGITTPPLAPADYLQRDAARFTVLWALPSIQRAEAWVEQRKTITAWDFAKGLNFSPINSLDTLPCGQWGYLRNQLRLQSLQIPQKNHEHVAGELPSSAGSMNLSGRMCPGHLQKNSSPGPTAQVQLAWPVDKQPLAPKTNVSASSPFWPCHCGWVQDPAVHALGLGARGHGSVSPCQAAPDCLPGVSANKGCRKTQRPSLMWFGKMSQVEPEERLAEKVQSCISFSF